MEEDRCFLSVLLFNYRNNGRFPFQLIILLVSHPHCTRTGRDTLIVGIVLKYTWYSGICYVKRYPEGSITLTVNGNTLYYITPDNDLTLNILLITPWDNARLVCEVGLTSHWSCLNVSAWRGEGSLDDLMNHSCSISSTSLSVFFADLLHLTLPSFFFSDFLCPFFTHIHVNLLLFPHLLPFVLFWFFQYALLPFLICLFHYLVYLSSSFSSPLFIPPPVFLTSFYFVNPVKSPILCSFLFLLLHPSSFPSSYHQTTPLLIPM